MVCGSVLGAVHSTLEQATTMDQSLPAATLYRTARELLDLFRAVGFNLV